MTFAPVFQHCVAKTIRHLWPMRTQSTYARLEIERHIKLLRELRK